MKVGGLLTDVVGSLFRRPATEGYPATRDVAPLRLRGPVRWERSRCTGCGVCVMDCPSNALTLFTLDKSTKHFVLEYRVDRCTFCGQCTESCKQTALWMSHTDWELASPALPSLTIRYGLPEDVEQILEHGAAPEVPNAQQ